MVEPFKRHSSRPVLETPIFTVREDRCEHPNSGVVAPFVVLETPDWVNVIALTDDDELLLVKQWRFGSESVELELVAGLVDPGESARAAAERELLEETGYAARELALLGTVRPSAAFQDNTCTTYLALGCHKVAEPDPDESEDLELVVVPRAAVPGLVARGELRSAVTVAALYFWTARGGLPAVPTAPDASAK